MSSANGAVRATESLGNLFVIHVGKQHVEELALTGSHVTRGVFINNRRKW